MSIGQIALALSKAQSEFGKVQKDKTAKVRGKSKSGKDYEYSYDYATLAGVFEAIIPALSSNGIAVLQPVSSENGVVTVTTLLVHESGESLNDEGLSMKFVDGDPQAMGSAVTYLRRYGLTSLVGVAQEDDDGSQAVVSNKTAAKPSKVANPKPNPKLADLHKRIEALPSEAKDDVRSFLRANHIAWQGMTSEQYEAVLSAVDHAETSSHVIA